jgi:hypothetical protein
MDKPLGVFNSYEKTGSVLRALKVSYPSSVYNVTRSNKNHVPSKHNVIFKGKEQLYVSAILTPALP